MELGRKIGDGCVLFLKAVLWLLFGMLRIALEILKVGLLLFGLILRLFTCFVKAGTT